MTCKNCQHWIIARKTIYEDGSEIVNSQSPEGKGDCLYLEIETSADFGCNAFAVGDVHVEIIRKPGAPWMHHRDGPCPECSGRGSNEGACGRCCGTGKVRYYDDGYIGEERTREHPKEKELRLQKPPDVPDPGTVLRPVEKSDGALMWGVQ